MNIRYVIFAIGIMFLVMGFANAGENINYFNKSTKITFEEIDFTIPEGFGQSKNDEKFDDLGSQGKTCFYINQYGGEIIITVVSDWMGMSLDELQKDDSTKTTINGHEGWKYRQENLTCFGYVSEDRGIIVAVTNQTRLNEIII